MFQTSESSPSPVRIFEALRAFQETAALKSAIELGVFTAIADGATTAAKIASACNASERGIRILCDTLVTSEILEKRDARYGNTRDTAIFLNRHSPAYIGSVADFICQPEMTTGFLQTLTECVRKGGTAMPAEGSMTPEHPMWVTFARAMAPLMALPRTYHCRPSRGTVARGSATKGTRYRCRTWHVRDRLRQTHPTSRNHGRRLGPGPRSGERERGRGRRFVPLRDDCGECFQCRLRAESYDAALLTNFLHHFDAATNERLLRKVHGALKDGGKAVTLEFVPDEDRVSPPTPARFAITMLFSTAHGDAYTFSELETMFRNAGFTESTGHLIETQQSVIISTK